MRVSSLPALEACPLVFRSTYHQQALNLLLMTIEQHFPRTKRLACIRDAKQAGVLRAREQKKAAALCDESAVRWQDLPDEILLLVFAKLEPLDLSRASCVCVAWDSLAGSNLLWQKFLPNACPASSAVRSSKISFLGKLLLRAFARQAFSYPSSPSSHAFNTLGELSELSSDIAAMNCCTDITLLIYSISLTKSGERH